MPVESFRGYVATITAAALLVGGIAAAMFAWMNSTQMLADGTLQERDLAIIFGLIGSLTGGAATYLFLTDASARASRASERSFDAGRHQSTPEPADAPTRTLYTEADAARHMEGAYEPAMTYAEREAAAARKDGG